MLLASCSSSVRGTCPTPPSSLLTPAAPLSLPGQPPAKTLREVTTQYVEDIGKYEDLRAKHNQLVGWWSEYCLEGDNAGVLQRD
jgi:hypothetical protein